MLRNVILCTGLFIIRNTFCTEMCKPKIAIIGGGIGGASTSHFLTELFNGNLDIDLFEANKIGGRLATIEIDKKEYESGGAIIHPRNKYMQDFKKLLGLEYRKFSGDQRAGIWNNQKFVFMESNWKAVTFSKLVYRYGFQPFKLFKYVGSLLDDFENIYARLEQGKAFENIIELLSAMNEEFPKFLQISIKEHLENLDFSSEIIDELVAATVAVNYGQETNIHSFVGCISLAGADSNLWAIKGGNKEVPEHLIHRNGNVTVLPCQVEKVRFLNESIYPKYEVEYRNRDSTNTISSIYDVVIIATPLTRDHDMSINFENFPNGARFVVPGQYQTTVATFLKGNLNPYQFGLEEGESIDVFSCVPNKTKISSLGKLSPVDNNFKETPPGTWKIFSREKLTLPYLTRLFTKERVSNIKEKVWKAYPRYTTEIRADKFRLHEALYHVNAIEWIASAMEMSAIGGRNVANLAYNDFTQRCLPSAWSASTETSRKVRRYLEL